MNYYEIIKKLSLFKNKTIVVTELIGGLTNLNFRIQTNFGDFVAVKWRSPKCGYIYNGKDIFLNKSETDKLIKKISDSHMHRMGFAKGHSAYLGRVQGKTMIVEDPAKARSFKQGQILIAGMTRPDFLPLMKRAGAIVTDAGGVLCHAAIISRELHVPCIVGTQTATKAFKTGDLVEVDANKGIVRKLKVTRLRRAPARQEGKK